MYAVVVIVIISFFLLWQKYRKKSRFRVLDNQMSGPPIPMFSAFTGNKFSGEKVTEYNAKYKSFYRLWIGKYFTIVASDIETIKEIYSNHNILDKSDFCIPFHEIFGTSVFTVRGSDWKKHRTSVQPIFYNSHTFSKHELDDICQNFFLKLKDEKLLDREVDLWNIIPLLTFDVFTRFVFDISFNEKEKEEFNFHVYTKRLVESMFVQSTNPWYHIDLFRQISNYFNGTTLAKQNIKIFSRKVLKCMSQNCIFYNTIVENPAYSEQETLNEIVAVSAAGIYTTAVVISSFLLTMAMYPEIQEKIYEEITMSTSDDDSNMIYLNSVLAEVFRLFTPVPFIYRKVAKDSIINSLLIPKNTSVVLDIVGMHYDETIYADAKKFNPTRFLHSTPNKYAFIPFGSGIRNCGGKLYAIFMIKNCVIQFVKKFRFQTETKLEDIVYDVGFIRKIENGYPVSISLRNNCNESK